MKDVDRQPADVKATFTPETPASGSKLPTCQIANLTALGGKPAALLDVVQTMAETVAGAHLISCDRLGADSVEVLAHFAGRFQWRDNLVRSASAAHSMVTRQWRNYYVDYDANPEGLIRAAQST